jgi:hypothetical protein
MKQLIFTALAFCFFMTLKAQNESNIKEQNPTFAVAIVPNSFAHNAAELNFDLRLADRQWLTIAPRFQFGDHGTTENYSHSFSEYYGEDADDAIKSGFGLGLNYRYFPLTRHARKFSDGVGPFISAGISGKATTYEYYGNSYIPYTDIYGNAGTTIDENKLYTDKLSQFGLETNIGYSMRFFDILFVEAYMGVGTRYSNYTYDQLKGINLGRDAHDTGYTGYCFTGGLRFGIFLNRYIH